MRPSERGNIILETKEDYKLLHPAALLGGFEDYYVDDFGRHHWIDYSRYGLETAQITPRFAPINPENPEIELPTDFSRAVIRGLVKMGKNEELIIDLGFNSDLILPEQEPPF